jgi:hypothetical protein
MPAHTLGCPLVRRVRLVQLGRRQRFRDTSGGGQGRVDARRNAAESDLHCHGRHDERVRCSGGSTHDPEAASGRTSAGPRRDRSKSRHRIGHYRAIQIWPMVRDRRVALYWSPGQPDLGGRLGWGCVVVWPAKGACRTGSRSGLVAGRLPKHALPNRRLRPTAAAAIMSRSS